MIKTKQHTNEKRQHLIEKKNHQLNNIDFSEKIHVPYVKIYSENNLSA